VLIRVHAAGVNFFETLVRVNRYAVSPPLPTVLGVEVAGTIERTGAGVEGLAPGTRVAAVLIAAGGGGYASHVVADARAVVRLPDALGFAEATALLVQGLTALYLIRQTPPRGKTVLVNAAAGGVGSLLVQLANRAGARLVVGAASTPAKRELVRSLGAAAALDYTAPDWATQLRAATGGVGPDVIYESVGGAITRTCLDALAPRGTIVLYGGLNLLTDEIGLPEITNLIFKNQSLTGFALTPFLEGGGLASALAELFDLAARKALIVTIGGSYPLERTGEAHAALEHRGTVGKLVLTP
jgi:NADPH2:quinone reductase